MKNDILKINTAVNYELLIDLKEFEFINEFEDLFNEQCKSTDPNDHFKWTEFDELGYLVETINKILKNNNVGICIYNDTVKILYDSFQLIITNNEDLFNVKINLSIGDPKDYIGGALFETVINKKEKTSITYLNGMIHKTSLSAITSMIHYLNDLAK